MRFILLLFFIPLTNSYAFGPLGHRIVAQIADKYLNPSTVKEVKNILGNESMARVANYPDFIKSDPKMSKFSSWHYLSIPKGQKVSESLKKHTESGEALIAIEKSIKALKAKNSSSNKEKYFSLAMLIHLVGDLHQPLHNGYVKDKGGNSTSVNWFGKDTNLHAVWDSDLLQIQELSYTEYAGEIIKLYNDKKIIEKENINPMDWVEHNRKYLSKVYEFKVEKYWEYKYTYKHRDYLEENIYLAGFRLAKILNDIYSK